MTDTRNVRIDALFFQPEEMKLLVRASARLCLSPREYEAGLKSRILLRVLCRWFDRAFTYVYDILYNTDEFSIDEN